MTTTVTVKTHSWPVQVETIDEFESKFDNGARQETTAITTEIVQPDTERQFIVTNSRSLTFAELPIPVQRDDGPTAA